MRKMARRMRWRPGLLGAALILGGAADRALAQDPPPAAAPDPAPAAAPAPPTPPVPNPASPLPGASREAELEQRVRQLEGMVQQLSQQMQQMAAPAAAAAPGTGGAAAGATTDAPGGTATPDTGTPATTVAPSGIGGVAAPGQSLPPNPPPNKRFDSPATLDNKKGNVKFGPGFEIRTDDDEYILQFHNLTQFDYRGYLQGGQQNVRDTFTTPRQWFMFSGRVGKPFGYFVSIANGFDVLSELDVFIDYDYDPRFRLRVGRYKTPFTYEFFVEPVQGLVVPERSIFFNNFAQNRDLGIMGFGRLFDKKFDYAVGLFNGVRNGFIALQNSKKVSAFVNYRPFGNDEGSLLENFNVGGSVYAGESQQLPIPTALRTIVPTTGNNVAGVPFLAWNNNVRESGFQAFWDLHLAYFYKQLEVIGEWGSGTQDYALVGSLQNRVRVPVQSFYVQGSYLLTGETRSSIGLVKPLSPFDIRKGQHGTGAWEPFFRYEYMDLGQQVFTGGLSDPNNWTNRVYMTSTGINWHMTQYMKMYFEWNHAEFGQPVLFAANRRQLTSDMFMVRFQLFF